MLMWTGIVYAAHHLLSGAFGSQAGTLVYLLHLIFGYPSQSNKQKFSSIQYSISLVPLTVSICISSCPSS